MSFTYYTVQQFLRDRLGHVLQGRNLVNLMIEAGFREVKSDYGSLPLCWGGYIGKLFYEVKRFSFKQ